LISTSLGRHWGADETRCDYLLIAEGKFHAGGLVVVLELKRGKLHADMIVKQLQAGASAAEKLVPQGRRVAFRPIAASGSTPKHERMKLRQRKIKFHGHSESIRLMSCGGVLAKALC